MLSKLNKIKEKVLHKEGDEVTSLYYLIKELGCLPDILGREYEVIYEGDKIKKIIQKPIPIPTLQTLFIEMNKDLEKQNKDMKKSGRKK